MMCGALASVKEPLGVDIVTMSTPPAPAGYRWVFVPYYVHYRTGKRVYPRKAKCFKFLVKA